MTLPPPPDSLSAELKARWQAICELIAGVEARGAASVLGLPPDGDGTKPLDELRRTYLSRVKDLHPDRLPAALTPLKPAAEEAVRKLSAAYERAEAGDPGMADAASADQQARLDVQTVLAAELELQRIEFMARLQDWDGALGRLEALLSAGQNPVEVHSLYAWLLFQKHGTVEGAPIAAMFAHVEQALALDGECERAHWTKALVLKQLGQTDAALEHFRKVLSHNPKHLDAQREIRLAESRAAVRGSDPAPRQSGFWGRWFGAKKSAKNP